MSAITDRFARARQLSRELFPAWSRKARARWVVAKLKTTAPKVAVSSQWEHDPRLYGCLRRAS